jgi:hypothetical protein
MSDAYSQGYEKGKRDAAAGKDRDLRPPLGQSVLRGKDYTEQYMQGVKDGYRAGKSQQK